MSSNLSATRTVPYLDLRYPNPTVTTFPIDMRSLKMSCWLYAAGNKLRSDICYSYVHLADVANAETCTVLSTTGTDTS